jgi:hypothetical protein
MTPDEERFLEAWKAIIEFSKTLIGLATSILTVILGLVVVGQLTLGGMVWATIACVILSIFFALHSYGKGIVAIEEGKANERSILCNNLSAFLLVAGIFLIAFVRSSPEPTVDEMLATIEKTAQAVPFGLKRSNFQSLKRSETTYEITYVGTDKAQHVVVYSVKEGRIETVR